jgi:hypothetical protein
VADRKADRIRRNARKITQAAVDKVAASIQEFGFRQPVVVDKDGVIIVGHVRLRALKKLGMTHVPVHVALGLTPAQVKAYRLMDNRSHEEVAWDVEMLGAELLELKDLNVELMLTGFNVRELDTLLRDPADDEKGDETPPLPAVAVSQQGDLWVCGPHRVLCGDATKSEAVFRLLGDRKPFLMVTDPPFGVSYDPAWRKRAGVNNSDRMGGSAMTTGRIGAKHGISFPVTSLMSGTVRCTPPPSPRVWRHAISRSEVRSSGRNRHWCWAAATITGNTSPAGMPYGQPVTGTVIARKVRCGKSRIANRMRKRSIVLRSR